MTKRSGYRAIRLRQGADHFALMTVMVVSSALTLVRFTVVAAFLPTENFAIYASLVAVGAIVSTLLSFGLVEATIKRFPRLISDGENAQMLADSRALMLQLGRRMLVFAVPLALIAILTGELWGRFGLAAVVLGFTGALNALVASMQRAAGNIQALATGTLLRSGLTFAVVSAASLSGNIAMVVIAEILGFLAAAILSEWLFFRRRAVASDQSCQPHLPSGNEGRLIFVSYLMVSAPFYLDRSYVAVTMGLDAGARYAVLSLALMAALTLIGTVAQRAGPDAIRQIYAGKRTSAIKRTLAWIALNTSMWLAGIAAFAAVLWLGWLPHAFARYAIELRMLPPLAMIGILLNTVLLEFVIIGLDRERHFAACAALFAVSMMIVALWGWLAQPGLATFMWALAIARGIYFAALVVVLLHDSRSRSIKPATNGLA